MGTFTTRLGVNNGNGGATQWVEAQVDTGASHTLIPEVVLAPLGIQPKEEKVFSLADGSKKVLPVGHAWFRIEDREGPGLVVFGDSDKCLVGATTLQVLGLIPDITNHRLIPEPELTL